MNVYRRTVAGAYRECVSDFIVCNTVGAVRNVPKGPQATRPTMACSPAASQRDDARRSVMKRDGGHSSDAFPPEDFWLRFPRSENVFRAHDQALTGPTMRPNRRSTRPSRRRRKRSRRRNKYQAMILEAREVARAGVVAVALNHKLSCSPSCKAVVRGVLKVRLRSSPSRSRPHVVADQQQPRQQPQQP